MLSEYIRSAMRRATYEILSEGTFYKDRNRKNAAGGSWNDREVK